MFLLTQRKNLPVFVSYFLSHRNMYPLPQQIGQSVRRVSKSIENYASESSMRHSSNPFKDMHSPGGLFSSNSPRAVGGGAGDSSDDIDTPNDVDR